jgi:hypothetical protein
MSHALKMAIVDNDFTRVQINFISNIFEVLSVFCEDVLESRFQSGVVCAAVAGEIWFVVHGGSRPEVLLHVDISSRRFRLSQCASIRP